MKHKYKDIVHKHNNIHHIHPFSIKRGDYQSSFHKMFISLTLQEVFKYFYLLYFMALFMDRVQLPQG